MKVILADLPPHIGGFTKKTFADGEDWYTVILNARLTDERQREAYEHEMDHIEAGDLERMDLTADELEYCRHKESRSCWHRND